jgi:uncharacterized membrane protein (UPF0182 family)
LALIKAVDYYFERLQLVLSRSHVVNGATATSVHANKPALFLLMVIAVIAAVLFLANIRQRGWVLPVVGVALWALVAIVVGGIYPAVYQALRVKPSEFTREAPYINDNINATLAAYGLNLKSVTVDNAYNYSPTVTTSQIQGSDADALANQQTLANVRLLDPAVNLLGTFNNYQHIFNYYTLSNLNLDRYTLPSSDGSPKMTATIASVRELGSVPSGFVNQHLTYTHGYGAVLAPVSQPGVNNDGTPNFSLSNIPPVGIPALNDQGSQIYYGLGPATGGYVIAASKTAELNYQSQGGGQQPTHYTGKGGVQAGSIVRRLAFTLRFGDANFILSGQISPSSRVMFNRNVVAAARKAAPFLKFDSDPYAVIDNGQVYWILDAYTTTDNYPYSQNAITDGVQNSGLDTTFNYVRNSVKVVVSAYDGSMHFFDMGTGDPILRVYEKAFPDLFTPFSKAESLIPGITDHFRYPEDLFTVQTNMYGRYHLTDPQAFYNQALAWEVSPKPSNELSNATATLPASGTASTTTSAAPRLPAEYTLAHQPGETNQDFMLLTPFVPRTQASTSSALTPSSLNLTAFMTASSAPGTYGQLTVYKMPQGVSVPGPGLIANAIKSNTTISKELTLLNQGGSTAELGAVGIVPIDNTLIYVQPIYVSSDPNNPVPLLRDVVVVYNGTAYDSGNASLDGALCLIQNPDGSKPFSQFCNTAAANSVVPSSSTTPSGNHGSGGSTTTTTPTTTTPANQSVQSLLQQANALFAAGDAAAKQGDVATWAKDYAAAKVYVQKALTLANGKSGG